MNMTLSKRGDYVMRAAIFLARSYGEPAKKIREVVADTEVPQAFASQILADLVRAGLASSRAGRGGGYLLTRDPGDISALEIVEAAEGPLAAERCALGEAPCRWDDVCPLHETWFAATRKVREVLADTTLAELATLDLAIAAGTYSPADAHRRHPRQVEVSDQVHVERSADEAAGVLASGGLDIGELARLALVGAFPQFSLDPFIGEGAIQPSRTSPVPGEGVDQRFQIFWKVSDREQGLHVESDVRIAPLDDSRCEVGIRAIWHQTGGEMHDIEVQKVAQKTVRLFLRKLATTLEQD